MNLQQVREGLINGKSFQRNLEDGGVEIVRPCGLGRFEHTVNAGQSGGVAECDISILQPDPWANSGWKLIHSGMRQERMTTREALQIALTAVYEKPGNQTADAASVIEMMLDQRGCGEIPPGDDDLTSAIDMAIFG